MAPYSQKSISPRLGEMLLLGERLRCLLPSFEPCRRKNTRSEFLTSWDKSSYYSKVVFHREGGFEKTLREVGVSFEKVVCVAAKCNPFCSARNNCPPF